MIDCFAGAASKFSVFCMCVCFDIYIYSFSPFH
ncbi:MAG: hypothetical protein ACI8RD_008203 [Bacillariaceae sp.]|jgi:hypothetical protein